MQVEFAKDAFELGEKKKPQLLTDTHSSQVFFNEHKSDPMI